MDESEFLDQTPAKKTLYNNLILTYNENPVMKVRTKTSIRLSGVSASLSGVEKPN